MFASLRWLWLPMALPLMPFGPGRSVIAPIVDPESLEERVQFARGTKIEDRTVYVKVDGMRSTVLVVYSRILEIVRETFGMDDGVMP